MNKAENRLLQLSHLYGWRSARASDQGLRQKCEEYGIIQSALYDRWFRKEYSRLKFDMGAIMYWRPSMESVLYRLPRWDRETPFVRWLFSRYNWDSCFMVSFTSAAKALVENIRIVLYWHLSPWFHMRYRFLQYFVNMNSSKLLDDGVGFAYVRNRQPDCAYYTMKFRGFRYTLTRKKLVGADGCGINAFHRSLESIASGKDFDESYEFEEEPIKEVCTTVCTGWVFGWKSFVSEMEKVASITEDLEWSKSL